MIFCLFLSSIEIYVIAAVIAAGVVALFVRPSKKGEVRQHLLAGVLCELGAPTGSETALRFECLDDGNVLMTRTGLPRLKDDGSVSIAVNVSGFDLEIQERITPGTGVESTVDTALFTLDFLGAERYHVRYVSEPTAMESAFTLSNRPGMSIVKQFKISS